jgi:2-keto-4-pentenoate hydratase/2-oxohepta-3-ene-1,7-dioic acid hydratase in catechol pathway
MTLKPGDLIYTGAMPPIPGMRRGMRVGDQVEVDVEGIGTMRNTVVGMRADRPR